MSTAPCPGLLLRDPGELIAAIPVLLGFRPTDSVVLILYTGHTQRPALGAVLRIDLPEPGDVGGWVDQLAAVVVNNDAAGVGFVLVGGNPVSATQDATTATAARSADRSPRDLPRRDLIDALTTELTETGTVVVDALWAASVDAGTWRCYRDPTRGGMIPDPATLPVVTALTVAGVVAYGSREEMAAVLAPDPAEDLAWRAELIAALGAVDPDREIRFLGELVDQVQSHRDGEPVLGDATIARVAHALGDGRVRDAALALCVGPLAGAAEWVWTVLVRAAPRILVANPAYLLGVCAYLRGEGALAGIALDLACQANPDHLIVGQLRRVLDLGLHPIELRRALEASVADSADSTISAGAVRSGRLVEHPVETERS